MQHHFLCNISYDVVAASMENSLKYMYVTKYYTPHTMHVRVICILSQPLLCVQLTLSWGLALRPVAQVERTSPVPS